MFIVLLLLLNTTAHDTGHRARVSEPRQHASRDTQLAVALVLRSVCVCVLFHSSNVLTHAILVEFFFGLNTPK